MKNYATQAHGKDYIFFRKPENKNGFYGQRYKSNFIENNISYSCNEQYMMAQKALLFNDMDSFQKIMNTQLPNIHKELGRGVQGFNQSIWEAHARNIVYRANYLKFTQNQELYNLLIDSGEAIIVEASPKDPIRGIGLNIKQAIIQQPHTRPGTSYLGKEIMKVRDNLLHTIS